MYRYICIYGYIFRPNFWDGVFCKKQLTIERSLLFLQKSPSYMFDGVLNLLLRWCI